MKAHDTFDQGALARAVLPNERVERPRRNRERDLVIGDERPEPLGHIQQLQPRRLGRAWAWEGG